MVALKFRTVSAWMRVGVWAAVGAGLSACGERQRLTFEPPPNGIGPRTFIDVPGRDTTIDAGPDFLIFGTTVDSQKIDTVYFETVGGVSNFPPFHASTKEVQWALPLTTMGLGGESVIIRAFATDVDGNRGDTAIRRIAIQ